MAFAGAFTPTAGGTYEYTDTANWGGGVIGNNWTSTITGNQTLTFAADYTAADNDGGGAGVAGLNIANTGLFNHTFIGTGGNRTLTLGGGISLGSSTTNTNTVTLGSTTEGQKLNVALGASRTLSIGTNRTLDVVNVVSGTASVTKSGLGTLKLTNLDNTYTGSTSIGTSGQSSGVLEVTKLANGGQSSSIGTSNNSSSNLVFGGTTTGTLRYVGTGHSTDRRFLIGGVGAIFDASGTGAINWTNTAAVTYASTGNARTITFKGTNTDANTMSTAFSDSGLGQTSILKQDSGRWILAGTNTHTGATTIDAGTLELGSSNSGGNGSALIMNGGTFATGGFSETFGTLDVNGNAIIDMGSGTSALVFGDSSGITWDPSVSLTIINFDLSSDSIRFGATSGGLTLAQLGQITIVGFESVGIDDEGYLTAIPEPSTYAVLAGAGGLLMAGARRRVRIQ